MYIPASVQPLSMDVNKNDQTHRFLGFIVKASTTACKLIGSVLKEFVFQGCEVANGLDAVALTGHAHRISIDPDIPGAAYISTPEHISMYSIIRTVPTNLLTYRSNNIIAIGGLLSAGVTATYCFVSTLRQCGSPTSPEVYNSMRTRGQLYQGASKEQRKDSRYDGYLGGISTYRGQDKAILGASPSMCLINLDRINSTDSPRRSRLILLHGYSQLRYDLHEPEPASRIPTLMQSALVVLILHSGLGGTDSFLFFPRSLT